MSCIKGEECFNYRSSGFIGRYQQLVFDTVIPYQHKVLWDKAPDTEKSHVVKNFINAARALRGEDTEDGFYGMVFQDSDGAKWLEAAAYALGSGADPQLEADADELIRLICEAQDSDGYLNTYFTIKDRDKRWTNLLEAHELYCSGHMIEAACAYFQATGKRALLDAAIKNALHIYERFITKGEEGFPGHPEIELALMRLYRVTSDERFFELAKHFIDCRGQDPSFYAREAEKRHWTVWNSDPWSNEYRQSDKPVRELEKAAGHSVRAVYLYTAMADIAAETGDKELFEACKRLWKNITRQRMYVTGGIGSTVEGEAFTVDYDLPQDTAYCETCASIGLMFFARKMLENEIKGEYGDIMERAFYNTVLAGMQLDGKRFFYVNPLQIDPGISGKAYTHRHDLPVRPRWYACACCPPNVARLIGSIGKYVYGEMEDTVYCHMYAAGTAEFSNGISLECTTDYPYGMTLNYTMNGRGRLALRIPDWSKTFTLTVNDREISAPVEDGYVYVSLAGETRLTLTLDGVPRFIRSSTKVPRTAAMTALSRGPLVYCFEERDNGSVNALRLDRSQKPVCEKVSHNTLGDIVMMKMQAQQIQDTDDLYTDEPETTKPVTVTAVPYYTWGNRGENGMRVWMNVFR